MAPERPTPPGRQPLGFRARPVHQDERREVRQQPYTGVDLLRPHDLPKCVTESGNREDRSADVQVSIPVNAEERRPDLSKGASDDGRKRPRCRVRQNLRDYYGDLALAEKYSEAFARYDAELTNVGWSVSALTPAGDLVVSIWSTLLKDGIEDGTKVYDDVLSEWRGNVPGRNELRRHLAQVQATGKRIRLIEAVPKNAKAAAMVGNVPNEADIPKIFKARREMIGTLDAFDGDRLRYIFRIANQQAESELD